MFLFNLQYFFFLLYLKLKCAIIYLDKKVLYMSVFVFLLLMIICLGFIYLVHRYLGKTEFYLLAIIYAVISFILSFKIIYAFGISINLGIIFSSSLVMILYYFIRRYGDDDAKKVILVIIISTIICALFMLLNVFMTPSLYDNMSSYYQNLILNNLAIVVLYPLTLTTVLYLARYSFNELSNTESKRFIKMILMLIGISFIYTGIFIYFSYAIIIRFDVAIRIFLGNYLVMSLILIVYFLVIDKLFMIRKVKR